MLPWLLCLALALLLLLLLLKLHLLRRGMREIAGQVSARLSEDSNNLIFLSSRDRALRQLAAELNAQLRQLRRQRQRYAGGDRELKEAVTNISHDLRTPLTALCGHLDLLEAEALPEAAQRHIAAIRNRAGAMKHLTEELLHYSVILSTQEELALEPLSLNGALEESLASFYAALTQAGITPQVQLPEAPVVRMLNRDALARVFGNILSNALKYSAGDLAVTLSENGEACFSNAAPGLNEVQVGKLFDRFFTVEAARSSSGLGLSIAKTLVEHMGGQISAEYADGVLCIRLRFEE
ncbi:MAG: HAMP domain-containing histidine kinase [Ruminiclostridium sp.]|jgi:signal transduction histidine kinase|nr:HAMP domain-containing histidine kinase [Ruminiclostridium sp.]